jgi:hypothetical protein
MFEMHSELFDFTFQGKAPCAMKQIKHCVRVMSQPATQGIRVSLVTNRLALVFSMADRLPKMR